MSNDLKKADYKSKKEENKGIDCGWGRLIFGETYSRTEKLASDIKKERKLGRNILFYPLDPQMLLTHYPQDFFLNPSYTYKLDLEEFSVRRVHSPFTVRKAESEKDITRLNDIYKKMKMTPLRTGWWNEKEESVSVWVVEENENKTLCGGVILVDHYTAWKDPKKSVSIWALVVDSNAQYPGIGKALIRNTVAEAKRKKRKRMFLSVSSENTPARKLYESLGFIKTPILTVKNKTAVNEQLFISQAFLKKFSLHTRGIVQEAMKRGIHVEHFYNDFYRMSLGGREIMCHESLSEMTSSILQTQCNSPQFFQKILSSLNISYPLSKSVSRLSQAEEFLTEQGRVVLKTSNKKLFSEEISNETALRRNFLRLKSCASEVLIQKFEEGDLYRILLMENRVIAVVNATPPEITGNGENTIRQLIQKQSRRKIALSGGESKIPLDSLTRGYISKQGYSLDHILPKGQKISVGKTANYHRGGNMTDITEAFPSSFKKIAIRLSRALSAPVLDIEIIIPDLSTEKYYILEANIKPHLSYYPGQSVYEKFIDVLFPRTRK